jgi:Ni/Co efflux regulator RcnB
MKRTALHSATALAFLVAGIAAAGSVFADKPSSAGKGGGGKHSQEDRQDRQREAHGNGNAHFGDQHRGIAHDYYSRQFQSGRCPPGLAKKHNGCLPPGQAKKQYVVGEALPRNVTYYNVPPTLISQFPPPPAGYRYVRVENDVLLMSPRTRMVADALRNLGLN